MASTCTAPTPQTTQSHIESASVQVNPAWKAAALIVTARLASRQQRFTSYDVLEELAKSDVKTHDLRAIGTVMLEAKNLGLITSVGLVRGSNKRTRGATTLWESRLYQSTTPTASANSQPSGETQQTQ